MPTSLAASPQLQKLGADDDQVVMGDIFDPDALKGALEGCSVLIVVTSAVPVLLKRSLFKMMGKKLLGKKIGKPQFKWSTIDGFPEKVDFEGQLLQFKAAKAAGVEKVIVVSSMGGTQVRMDDDEDCKLRHCESSKISSNARSSQDDNFLNSIGKKEDGSEGDILKWKRKAEEDLVASGMSYAIIHPGGLTDKPAKSRKLVIDVDDKLLERKKRSIYRGDVATLCLAALKADQSFSLDVISEDVEDGEEGLQSAALALSEFLDKDVTYKY